MAIRPPAFGAAAVPTPRTQTDRWRGSSTARGYDRAWQAVRLSHLKAEPLCRLCGDEGRLTAAAVVDHIQTVADRPDLRLDDANLQSLCKPHHDARTARQVAGGHRGATGHPRSTP